MTKVYVVRHGQTAWNLEEVFRGRMDIPLDETGKKEVHLAGEALKDETLHAIYSSPLSRSMETAENIAKFQNIEVKPLEAIIDISYGEWEGVSLAEVQIASGLELGEQLIISDTARFEGAKRVLLRR